MDIPAAPLAHLELGDVIVLPDGRAMTCRSKVTLPNPVGSMSGFVLLGELEALLSVPPSIEYPFLVYVPIDHLPEAYQRAKVVYEGATNYWAPHLPALQGAMGELLYRVVAVRGSIDPVVIVYRGPEVVVFIRASLAYASDLSVLYMRRDDANDVDVDRYSSVVTNPGLPMDPSQLPQHVPQRLPQHVGR